MKKLITILFSGLALALTTNAIANAELLENIRPVQPTQSNLVANKSLIVQRFILADQSDVGLENLVTEVKRHAASDKDSQAIHVISNTQSAKPLAKKLSKRLKALNVKPNIHITHNKTKNSLYPLYVEIHQIAKRNSLCRIETAEDHMGYDPYYDCALRHNNQIQLKY